MFEAALNSADPSVPEVLLPIVPEVIVCTTWLIESPQFVL